MTPGHWTDGEVPGNVRLGDDVIVRGEFAFKRMHSAVPDAIAVGARSTLDGVQFALGPGARLTIGEECAFTNAVLLAEDELRIGDRVLIGWNATIADTDFHPLAPAERIADAIACSPGGDGRPRPPIPCAPVVIGDDVYVGPAATILKGVTIGPGAWIEPGSVVTADVPGGARVLGNPARVVAEAAAG
jgi:acetyltransferase-like isoleucine patch superfamily enzyme